MNPFPESLTWVRCQMRDRRPNWLNTDRILAEMTARQQRRMLKALRAGKVIYLEDDDMHLEVRSMASPDQQRLAHLLGFERAGFTLTAFQTDWALYSRDDQDYWSMQERMEWQFIPRPGIAINRQNVPVLTPAGKLLDVFVPANQAIASFIIP